MGWPFTTRRRLELAQAQTVEAFKAIAMIATDRQDALDQLASARTMHRDTLAARDEIIARLDEELATARATITRLERRLDGWVPADVATELRFRILQLEAQLSGVQEVGTCPQA